MVAAHSTNSTLPTLSSSFKYPSPTVPPTAGAPYLQSSKLPQDFIFIVVGAALAFFAFLILAWRIGTAWSINRSFKRHTDTFYSPLPDLKKPSATIQTSHQMNDWKLPPNFSQNTNSNLFFSPTADVAKYKQRPPSFHMPAGHLPAGHYRNNSDSATQR